MFLIFGKTGWIGGLLAEELKKQGAKFALADARLEDRAAIIADIEKVSCMSWSCLVARPHPNVASLSPPRGALIAPI